MRGDPYTTDSMFATAAFVALGHSYTAREESAGRVVFEFARLDRTQAEALLSTPDAALCRKFWQAYRGTRSALDMVQHGVTDRRGRG